MKSISAVMSLFAALMIAQLLGPTACQAQGEPDASLEFGRFGEVAIYAESPAPSYLVLFISGDGGWNLGVVDMARALAALDALVAGIDITHYERELADAAGACSDVAADLSELAHFIEKEHGFQPAKPPVLIGYSSGATLVYAALVQSNPGEFSGAISLGFCPDLPLTKPLCRGSGLEWEPGPKGRGYSFLPATTLQDPWIAFQGTIDQVCDARATDEYVKQVTRGEIVLLPKVGHGFSVQRNWMPQFRRAFARVTGGTSPDAR